MLKGSKKNKEILKVAVSGGVASGKSSFCRSLASMGFPVIDLDLLARKAVLPAMPAYHSIVAAFGPDVVGADSHLDRAWLRERIIRDPAAKKTLESIVHPFVFSMLDKDLADLKKEGEKLVFVEFPLLFELGMEGDFDKLIVVYLPFDLQLSRLMQRDKVDKESAEGLIDLQMSLDLKAEKADLVFDNSAPFEYMEKNIESFIEKAGFLSLKKAKNSLTEKNQ